MRNLEGESESGGFCRAFFDRRLKFEFHGSADHVRRWSARLSVNWTKPSA